MPSDALRAFGRSAGHCLLAAGIALGLAVVPGTAVLVIAPSTAHAAEPPVDLGVLDSFAVFAGTTVTNTGPTIVGPDLGVSPGTAVTGFTPPGPGEGTVTGTIHTSNATSTAAQAALATAYADVAGRTGPTFVTADIGGQTLTPGLYKSSIASLAVSGTLTLDGQGDPNAVFIFQMDSTLTTGTDSEVALIGGAQACNVFFQVGSSATLGTGTDLRGNVLAMTSITVNAGVTITGRVLARDGAVTLDTNNITAATCAPGFLTISTPNARNLGSGVSGSTITSTLGDVTVDDQRGATPAAWTATVSSTDFTAAGVPDIPASAVTYTPGAPVDQTGDGTFTAGAVGTLSTTPRDAYIHTGGAGINQLIWNPTLTVAVPLTATATIYTCTVTHLVA
jgi:hypothetical protein